MQEPGFERPRLGETETTAAAGAAAWFMDVESRLVKLLSGAPRKRAVVAWAADGRCDYAAVGDAQTEARAEWCWQTGCITKLFTAALVEKAQRELGLALDQPLTDALGLDAGRLPHAAGVTIRHLLEHTHGLDDSGLPHCPRRADRFIDVSSLLRRLAPHRFAPPGALYSYSNAGAWLLAAALERRRGRRYAEMLSLELFAPRGLGMHVRLPSLVPGSPGRVCPAMGAALALSTRALLSFLRLIALPDLRRHAPGPDARSADITPLPGWNPLERGVYGAWKYHGEGWFGHGSAWPGASLMVRVHPRRRVALLIASRDHPAPVLAAKLFARVLPEFRNLAIPNPENVRRARGCDTLRRSIPVGRKNPCRRSRRLDAPPRRSGLRIDAAAGRRGDLLFAAAGRRPDLRTVCRPQRRQVSLPVGRPPPVLPVILPRPRPRPRPHGPSRPFPSPQGTFAPSARRAAWVVSFGIPVGKDAAMSAFGLRHFAEQAPEFVAIVGPGGERWTRRELKMHVDRLAAGFAAAGLSPGDALAIAAPNCPEYLAVYLGALAAGLSVVPVNWHLSEPELDFVLRDSGARALVAHQGLGPARLAALERRAAPSVMLLSIGAAAGFVPLEQLPTPSCRARVRTGPDDRGRLLAYTSATTGRPKAVVLPAGNAEAALHNRVRANAALGVLPEDGNVHLCASMLYHSAPLGGCEVALEMGHRVVLVDRWEPEALLRLIDAHAVTTTFMVPAMFVRLLKLPGAVRCRYSTASLRAVVHGGAPCPVEVKRRMLEWWGNVLWESYGASEAQGTLVSPQEWVEHPGTVGRPMPGSAIKILDEAGRELPANETGLVYMLPQTGDRFEYKDDPEKTRSAYRGEYVTVGDLGFLDDQGYLFLCGRDSELIISSGMNIYPAEIETALVQHAAVADCAVLGEPHALLGEVPKALVQLEPGVAASAQLTAELLRYLGERLAAMKLPKRVEYVAALPRDPSGKLRRRELR